MRKGMPDHYTIANAVERAISAFWQVVSAEIPNESGDLPPDVATHFERVAEQTVSKWAEHNGLTEDREACPACNDWSPEDRSVYVCNVCNNTLSAPVEPAESVMTEEMCRIILQLWRERTDGTTGDNRALPGQERNVAFLGKLLREAQ